MVAFITLLGISGAILILLAFILEQFNVLNKDSLIYGLLNFLGGLILVVYAYLIESYPFVLLNLVWSVVAFRDLWIVMRR